MLNIRAVAGLKRRRRPTHSGAEAVTPRNVASSAGSKAVSPNQQRAWIENFMTGHLCEGNSLQVLIVQYLLEGQIAGSRSEGHIRSYPNVVLGRRCYKLATC